MADTIFLPTGMALVARDWHEHRVITLDDIDRVHQQAEGTAARIFQENRARFVGKEDYFELTSESAIWNLDLAHPQGDDAVILMTEMGYLMLAKFLTNDSAWEAQRVLLISYFRRPMPLSMSAKRRNLANLKESLRQIPSSTNPWPFIESTWKELGVTLPALEYENIMVPELRLMPVPTSPKDIRAMTQALRQRLLRAQWQIIGWGGSSQWDGNVIGVLRTYKKRRYLAVVTYVVTDILKPWGGLKAVQCLRGTGWLRPDNQGLPITTSAPGRQSRHMHAMIWFDFEKVVGAEQGRGQKP